MATTTVVAGVVAMILAEAAFWIWWLVDEDIEQARARGSQGSTLIDTRCGPIEVPQAGAGVPLLVVHGSGGGHDFGTAFAESLAQHGVRVIAMSRFGYLRTPMPADASAAAQADSAAPVLAWVENTMLRTLGSDFLYWAAIQVARKQVTQPVPGTPAAVDWKETVEISVGVLQS